MTVANMRLKKYPYCVRIISRNSLKQAAGIAIIQPVQGAHLQALPESGNRFYKLARRRTIL